MVDAETIDDGESRAARSALIAVLGPTLQTVGKTLWVGGALLGGDRAEGRSPFGYGSDSTAGLGIVAQIGGELCVATALLIESNNIYGAATLLRQLVEVEYLAWAFAEDDAEAASWLRATEEELQDQWQPRHMRERSKGRFRSVDYSHHCKMGGHPTRRGARLLPGHEPWPSWFASLELAIHGASVWSYVDAAIKRIGYQDVTREQGSNLVSAIAEWHRTDRLRNKLYDSSP